MKKLNVLPYGAVELKRQINSSTVKGFILSLLFFALVGFIPSVINSVINDEKDSKMIEIDKTFEVISVKLGNSLSDDNSETNSAEEVNRNTNNQAFKETISKKMIPVDIAINDLDPVFDDSKLLSDLGKIEFKSIGSGNNNFEGGDKPTSEILVSVDENFRDEYNHKSVQKNPGLDYDKLKSIVKYPTLAKEMNLSGLVHVAALIRKDGKLIKSYIYKSTNSLFEKEALRAVKSYNDFSPAFQNEIAVDCWIIIPIKFKIK